MRISAVMMAARTRGTASVASAAASAGTTSACPVSARAAAQRHSACGLARAACCEPRSGRLAPTAGGALLLPLTNGISTHQGDDCGGDLLDRLDHLGATVLDQFPRHTPDNRGRLCLGDRVSVALSQLFHRLGAV